MRVAVVVAKHRHNIVERNRLKRRLRELIRVRLIPGGRELDVVIRSLPGAYKATLKDLTKQIDDVQRQLSSEA
jgi:ribonuclease P protein component